MNFAIMKYCRCGCGQEIKSGSRFVRGHNSKGENNPFRGKHHTEEAKNKIGLAQKGKSKKPFSEEHKENISKSKQGHFVSEESKEKNRISHLGKSPSNYVDGEQRYLKEWGLIIKERDNYNCQICSKEVKGRNCISHHIKSKEKFPECRFDFDNGITLCSSCHISIHHKGKTQIAWNKGLKGVQIGGMKGKQHSEETKKKMSETRKGKPWSEIRKQIQENKDKKQ